MTTSLYIFQSVTGWLSRFILPFQSKSLFPVSVEGSSVRCETCKQDLSDLKTALLPQLTQVDTNFKTSCMLLFYRLIAISTTGRSSSAFSVSHSSLSQSITF